MVQVAPDLRQKHPEVNGRRSWKNVIYRASQPERSSSLSSSESASAISSRIYDAYWRNSRIFPRAEP